jgi:hypothetical protein
MPTLANVLFLLPLFGALVFGLEITGHSCNEGGGCDTSGGLITFTVESGMNTDSIDHVLVNGVACETPYWSVNDTDISCILSPGSWATGAVYVEIETTTDTLSSIASGTFAISYAGTLPTTRRDRNQKTL